MEMRRRLRRCRVRSRILPMNAVLFRGLNRCGRELLDSGGGRN